MPDDRSVIAAAAKTLSLELDGDRIDSLVRYSRLLSDRAIDAGLISESDRDHLVERHVIDCMRVLPLVSPGDVSCLDLGSGAGLPGIVVAIGAPRLRVELVDARRRRAAFLELVVESLDLGNASVTQARIEDLDTVADLCLARALAPPVKAWKLVRLRLRPGGRFVYFAGARREVPADLPDGPLVRVVPSPLLESSGPLVIMTRQ